MEKRNGYKDDLNIGMLNQTSDEIHNNYLIFVCYATWWAGISRRRERKNNVTVSRLANLREEIT